MTTVENLREKVDYVLEQVRPYIQSHGGDVNLLEVTPERVARLELTGACVGCPMSFMTLRMGIQRLLEQEVPELQGVEAIGMEDFQWPEGFDPEDFK